MDLQATIASLSAGTIATMAGSRDYDSIDRAREKFRTWASGRNFATWQEAWEAYSRGATDEG